MKLQKGHEDLYRKVQVQIGDLVQIGDQLYLTLTLSLTLTLPDPNLSIFPSIPCLVSGRRSEPEPFYKGLHGLSAVSCDFTSPACS